MRKVILAMQMTLDGFVAGPNGEMDWLISSDDEWNEIFHDLESADTFLTGAKMYPEYAGYWRGVLNNPSSPKNELKFARLADKTQHIVFSKTITTVDWANTRVAKDPVREIAQLKQQPGKDIILWGGATMAAAFINLRLIDEYRLTVNPTILGGGKSPFNNLTERHTLKFLEAKPLKSGMIILRYNSV